MKPGQRVTAQSGSNLALAFRLAPPGAREDLCSLYAFCRLVDDVADDDSRPAEERRASLAAWREDIRRAAGGERPRIPINQELQPVIRKRGLPLSLFEELLDGVESDLDTLHYETHQELQRYCYRVASVVGLLTIGIAGCSNPRCREYAIQLGLALQYINILRDVASDARRGRIYLPREDLRRFGVEEAEILEGRYSDRYFRLAGRSAGLARGFHRKARELLPREDRRALLASVAMGRIYAALLGRLRRRRYDVFGPGRVRLPRWRKAAILLRCRLGL